MYLLKIIAAKSGFELKLLLIFVDIWFLINYSAVNLIIKEITESHHYIKCAVTYDVFTQTASLFSAVLC